MLLGVDNAGKTEIAHKICKMKRTDYLPTSGCKIYDLKVGKWNIALTELGGGPNIRGIWKYYLLEAYGVIYVIDSSDITKLEESKMILSELLSNPHLEGKPFLILGNKQDMPSALDYLDIFYFFGLEQLANMSQSPCMLEVTGNYTDTNGYSELDIGLEWLTSAIMHRVKAIRNMIKFFQQLEDVKNEIASLRPVTGGLAKIHRKSARKLKLRPNTAPNVQFKTQTLRDTSLLIAFKTTNTEETTPPNVVPEIANPEISIPSLSPTPPEIPQSPKESMKNNYVVPTIEYLSDNADMIDEPDDLQLSSMNITEVQVQVHRVDEKSPFRNELPLLNNIHQKSNAAIITPLVPNGHITTTNNGKNHLTGE